MCIEAKLAKEKKAAITNIQFPRRPPDPGSECCALGMVQVRLRGTTDPVSVGDGGALLAWHDKYTYTRYGYV